MTTPAALLEGIYGHGRDFPAGVKPPAPNRTVLSTPVVYAPAQYAPGASGGGNEGTDGHVP